MVIKYECPKCGRKYADWGAEKLGYKCPNEEHCKSDENEEIELVRSGQNDDRPVRSASLKRSLKRRAPAPKPRAAEEDEALAPDVSEMDSEDEYDESTVEDGEEDSSEESASDDEEEGEKEVVAGEFSEDDDEEDEDEVEVENELSFEDSDSAEEEIEEEWG